MKSNLTKGKRNDPFLSQSKAFKRKGKSATSGNSLRWTVACPGHQQNSGGGPVTARITRMKRAKSRAGESRTGGRTLTNGRIPEGAAKMTWYGMRKIRRKHRQKTNALPKAVDSFPAVKASIGRGVSFGCIHPVDGGGDAFPGGAPTLRSGYRHYWRRFRGHISQTGRALGVRLRAGQGARTGGRLDRGHPKSGEIAVRVPPVYGKEASPLDRTDLLSPEAESQHAQNINEALMLRARFKRN